MRTTIPTLIVLAMAACLPFAPAVDSFFVGDDFDFLRIVKKMDEPGDVLTSTFWGEYMPAFTLTFLLDWSAWGLDPVGYHLTSLAFHVAAVLALFWLVLTLTEGDRAVATVAALLFAVLPIHDEAVIYIAARGHVMMTAFVLAALALHARYRRGGETVFLALATLSLFLGLFSKETAILTPALVVASELFIHRDGNRRRARRALVPILALSIAYPVLRLAFLGVPDDKVGKTLEYGVEWGRLPLYFMLDAIPLSGRWLDDATVDGLVVPGTVLLVAALAWAVGRFVRARHGLPLYALSAFAVFSAPFLLDTLGVRRRYAYPASSGVCILLAVLLIGLWRTDRRWLRAVGSATLALLIAANAAFTIERSILYRAAGAVARKMTEQIEPLVPQGIELVSIYMVQLPYRMGGGSLDGAYLLHPTDFRSLVRVFGPVPKARVREVIKLEFAGDHRSEARVDPDGLVLVRMTSRTAEAHRALVEELEDEEGEQDYGRMRIQKIDDDAKSAVISVRFPIHPHRLRPNELMFVYSDGELVSL